MFLQTMFFVFFSIFALFDSSVPIPSHCVSLRSLEVCRLLVEVLEELFLFAPQKMFIVKNSSLPVLVRIFQNVSRFKTVTENESVWENGTMKVLRYEAKE